MALAIGLLILVQAAFASDSDSGSGWPGPLLTLDDDGPLVVARLQPESELVALRLSVPLALYPGGAAGAMAHQALVEERLVAGAARWGGVATLDRTADHATYGVVGPAREWDGLVGALRLVMTGAEWSPGELAVAARRAEQAALAELELPGARVRNRLREQLASGSGSGAGAGGLRSRAAGSGVRPTPPGSATAADRARLVVVGGVSEGTVRRTFADWSPRPALVAVPVAPLSSSRSAEPQLMTPWVAVAYRAPVARAPALAVVARLLDRSLDRQEVRSAAAELWLSPDASVLVLVGAAPSGQRAGRGANAARRAAERLVAAADQLARTVAEADVAAARRSLRAELVARASTAHGLAELLGELADRTGDPEALARFYAELERVDVGDVIAILLALEAGEPVTAELAP